MPRAVILELHQWFIHIFVKLLFKSYSFEFEPAFEDEKNHEKCQKVHNISNQKRPEFNPKYNSLGEN